MEAFLIFGTIFLFLDLSVELLKRKLKLDPETTRTGLHVVSTLLTAILPFYMTRNYIIALSLVFTLFLLLSKKMNILTAVHGVKRKTVGELIYSLSIGVAAILFLPGNLDGYLVSILVLAISDPMANILGKRIKSKELVFGKTVAGTTAFFVSALVVALAFLNPGLAVAVAVLTTLAELYSKNGYDNLTIIIATYLAFVLFA